MMETTMEAEPPQLRILGAYIGLILIWSSTPLAVVLSLRDLDAVWSLSLRMVMAAVLAHLLLRGKGLRLDLSRPALESYVIGSFSMFGAMLFTYLGARHLPSGLISILYGSSPLLVGLVSLFLLPGARLLPVQWLGMLLGLFGLVCMFWRKGSADAIDLPSVAYVLLGVSCYAISSLFLRKRSKGLSPLVQTTGALWVSVLGCLLILPFFRDQAPRAMPGIVSLAALLFSASFGSIVAMLCYFYLLRQIAASTVALTTLINPVFALCLGVLINHERFRPETLTGMGLIFVGLLAYYGREITLALRSRAMVAD